MTSLLRKYNVPGPRYTSYPTVPYWSDTPTQAAWVDRIAAALARSEAQGRGAAVYAHIPFCEALCTYCGCNTRITRNRAVGDPYVGTVLAEWRLYREALAARGRTGPVPVAELHLGGGTPTFLAVAELARLVDGLLEGARLLPDAELSLEADPRVTSAAQLRVLRDRGFRRLSLGIQDFDATVQKAVNRVQTEEDVARLVADARELGYTSVNFDLIYGLPFQTLAGMESTFAAVARLRPDRIAFYAYAHVPWIKPSQRKFTEADLPAGDVKRALYERGRERLFAEGYREIGMDHFALEHDALWTASQSGELHRNFMGYTPRLVEPLIGLGVSAIGDSWDAFAQNEKLLENYVERVERGELPLYRGHALDAEDLAVRRHVLDLMTRLETRWTPADAGLGLREAAPPRLEEMARDGLVEVSDRGVRVNEAGRPFLRNVCMAFDARLHRQQPQTRLFSQTI